MLTYIFLCSVNIQKQEYRMGGLFESLGYSETARFYLFFTVCIWVRLAMAYAVSLLVQKKQGKYLVAFVALIAMITNGSGLNESVWWSRRAHFVFATALFISVVCGQEKMAGPIVAADTVFGIIHTLLHHDVVSICPIF